MAESDNIFQEYSDSFDRLCQERHEAGQAEYGKFTFIQNDVVKMMAEELADTANYCRMQFIKLMILQNMLVDELNDKGQTSSGEFNLGVGPGAFKGVGEVGWNK